jgi:nucleoside phosphorylase
MIYLCTALYSEAELFITLLHLKKDLSQNKFQIFSNESFTLIITGSGAISPCVAVTYLFSHYQPTPSDLLINVGTCGCFSRDQANLGECFAIHKITELSTGRTFYPDLIIKQPFLEAEIITSPMAINCYKNGQNTDAFLVDMEAASIYQSALYFLSNHQLYFFKIISDYCDGPAPSSLELKALIQPHAEVLISWALCTQKFFQTANDKELLSEQEILQIRMLSHRLHLSDTMEKQLFHLFIYQKLRGKDIVYIIQHFITEQLENCNTKSEGKKYFAILKQQLI